MRVKWREIALRLAAVGLALVVIREAAAWHARRIRKQMTRQFVETLRRLGVGHAEAEK